jgi:hypothetical protein
MVKNQDVRDDAYDGVGKSSTVASEQIVICRNALGILIRGVGLAIS